VEGAGRVRETGERVAWTGVPHSYAELVAAPRASLVNVPDGVSCEVAAAAMLPGLTAHYLANDSYPVADGDWVLVHAAAGGVGRLLTQLARLRGGRVIATTSTEEKAALARSAGAETALGYDGFTERAREITGGEGVAAVYDGIARTTFMDGLRALRPMGYMILYGSASGQPAPLEVHLLARLGSLYLQRPMLGNYISTPERLRERAERLFAPIVRGQLEVHIGGRYALAEARRAHEDLQARRTTGKVLLLP
jgi:NADPH2:quinone reductase